MLFNDPTRGIDVEAKSDFYNIMRNRLLKESCSLLFQWHDGNYWHEWPRTCNVWGQNYWWVQKDELSEELIMKKSMGIVEEVAESDK